MENRNFPCYKLKKNRFSGNKHLSCDKNHWLFFNLQIYMYTIVPNNKIPKTTVLELNYFIKATCA